MQESRGAAPLLSWTILAHAVVALAAFGLAGAALASPPPLATPTPPAHPKTFAGDVGPVLDRWCVSCHGSDDPQGGLHLDSFDGIMRGGDAGPAIVAGDPAGSLLVAKIERRHRPSMPPRRRFPLRLVALIRAWIAAGAPP